jgi:hypothetical protein
MLLSGEDQEKMVSERSFQHYVLKQRMNILLMSTDAEGYKFRAAGHIFSTPGNQMLVYGQIMRSLTKPGFKPATFSVAT